MITISSIPLLTENPTFTTTLLPFLVLCTCSTMVELWIPTKQIRTKGQKRVDKESKLLFRRDILFNTRNRSYHNRNTRISSIKLPFLLPLGGYVFVSKYSKMSCFSEELTTTIRISNTHLCPPLVSISGKKALCLYRHTRANYCKHSSLLSLYQLY